MKAGDLAHQLRYIALFWPLWVLHSYSTHTNTLRNTHTHKLRNYDIANGWGQLNALCIIGSRVTSHGPVWQLKVPLAWGFLMGEGGTQRELVFCGKQTINTVGLTTIEIYTFAGQDRNKGP